VQIRDYKKSGQLVACTAGWRTRSLQTLVTHYSSFMATWPRRPRNASVPSTRLDGRLLRTLVNGSCCCCCCCHWQRSVGDGRFYHASRPDGCDDIRRRGRALLGARTPPPPPPDLLLCLRAASGRRRRSLDVSLAGRVLAIISRHRVRSSRLPPRAYALALALALSPRTRTLIRNGVSSN